MISYSNTQCKVDFYSRVFSNTLYVVVFFTYFYLFFLSFYLVVVGAFMALFTRLA